VLLTAIASSKSVLLARGLLEHESIQQAILEDFFQVVPVSDACKATATELSFEHTPPSSLSNFNPENLRHEKDLFLVEMFYPSEENTNQTWRLRLGTGGNVYSFYGKYGEAIPPQFPSHAPFMDEVWQNVAVDHSQHNPSLGRKYFVHQAGAYFNGQELKKPFYSPTLAVKCTPEQCMVASYGTQAHIPTTFVSSTLFFTRYVNCGQGVLEITSMIYNHEKHSQRPRHYLDHFNIPWGGVRTSTLPDMLMTDPKDPTLLTHLAPLPRFGAALQLADTGGYTIFATPARKDESFEMPFIVEEQEEEDGVVQDGVFGNSTVDNSAYNCNLNVASFVTNTDAVACIDDATSVCVTNTKKKKKKKKKSHLKLIVAESNACKETASQVMMLPLTSTIVFPKGHHQSPLLFINARTGHSIEVDSIEHWNQDGIFFRTAATVKEINSAFAAGDEIIVEKHDRLGLAYVHGKYENSLLKYGVAGNSARDYTVFAVIVKDIVSPGEMLYKRQYVITGTVGDIKSKSSSFSHEVNQGKHTGEEVTSMLSRPLYFFTTDFACFGLSMDYDSFSCQSDAKLACLGSTMPTETLNSMLFVVECGDKHYVGHDAYHFSPKKIADEIIRLYACDSMPDITPKFTLLGFVEEDGCKRLEGATYDSSFCSSTKPSSIEDEL